MNFDPFNDYKTHGYLRNHAREKDPRLVRDFEHRSFMSNIQKAFQKLAGVESLSYGDVLATHKILFEAVYPWAGLDRAQTAPQIAVRRGDIFFAHPNDAKHAVEYALRFGRDVDFMAAKPGEVMSYLAHAHPFLDGNGRTILTIHTELAHRAGVSIDWSLIDKSDYLSALTKDLLSPNKGILDAYLASFLRSNIGHGNLAKHVVKARGLEGGDYFPEVEYEQYSKIALKAGKRKKYVAKKNVPPKPTQT